MDGVQLQPRVHRIARRLERLLGPPERGLEVLEIQRLHEEVECAAVHGAADVLMSP